MKTAKRTLALLLTVCLLCSTLFTSAFAAEGDDLSDATDVTTEQEKVCTCEAGEGEVHKETCALYAAPEEEEEEPEESPVEPTALEKVQAMIAALPEADDEEIDLDELEEQLEAVSEAIDALEDAELTEEELDKLAALSMLLNPVETLEIKDTDVAAIEDTGYATLAAAIEAASGKTTIVLQKDTVESVVIPANAEITLDLNGHTLANSEDEQPAATNNNDRKHTITNNGKLTITGNGTVDNKSHQRAALLNNQNATAVLNGGEFTRSDEKGANENDPGGNSYYTIQNLGTMTINKGVTVTANGHYSSLVTNGYQNGKNETNTPTLTINGGVFTGGINTIKNDDRGVLTITDGTFENVTQHAVMNWNVAKIEGGSFESNTNSAVWNGYGDATMDQGKLTISGGTFKAPSNYYVIADNKQGGSVEISGGAYSSQYVSNASSYLEGENKRIMQADGTCVVDVPTDDMIQNGDIYYQDEDAAEANNTAKIGDKYYSTLQAAIAAAGENDTIELLNDVKLTEQIIPEKSISIEGNGHTLSSTAQSPFGRVFLINKDGLKLSMNNLTLAIPANGTGDVSNGAVPIVVVNPNTLDFTMTNCKITGEQDSDSTYEPFIINLTQGGKVKYTFTNNRVEIPARALLVNINNGSIIKDNVIDLQGEELTGTNQNGRTGVLSLVAAADGDGVTITGNTFKNANRVLGVDGAALSGDKITFEKNQFINVRYALELDPTKDNNKNNSYKIDNNYYQYTEAEGARAPRIEDASASGTGVGHLNDFTTEYKPASADENLVKNDVFYLDPSMDDNDLNTYTEIKITADPTSMKGKGTATLTVKRVKLPENAKISITCDVEGVSIVEKSADTYTVSLPNSTKSYKFTAAYAGDGLYQAAQADCTVDVTRKSTSSGGSSSSSSSKTELDLDTGKNGDVSVSPKKPGKGDKVTITAEPDDGYVLDSIKVTDDDGDKIKLTEKGENKYTFTMPSGEVTIETTFTKADGEDAPKFSFIDVSTGDWFAPAVDYVSAKGMMNGSNGYFSPYDSLTRGMIAQILYNLEGGTGSFAIAYPDVSASDWYANAVSWVSANGIMSGYGSGLFGANDSVTREQLALTLYSYAKVKGYDTSASAELTAFADGASTSEWAKPAMQWAVANGLFSGKTGNRLDPQGTATRAEVASILMRFCETIAK